VVVLLLLLLLLDVRRRTFLRDEMGPCPAWTAVFGHESESVCTEGEGRDDVSMSMTMNMKPHLCRVCRLALVLKRCAAPVRARCER